MTVLELLERIIAASAGATPEALKTYKSVFYARLNRHEGQALEAAANEVLATFRPKFGQPFPIPADFEAHLATGRLNALPSYGKPIRDHMAENIAKRRRLYEDWFRGQGAKIKAARPAPVYAACALLVIELAATCKADRLILTQEQITLCEERALHQARCAMFGPIPKTEEAWLDQIHQAKAAWIQEANKQ